MALLITPGDEEGSDYDDEEEWEQEFVYQQEEDMYELTIKPGHYMIVINHNKLEQISEHVVVHPLEKTNVELPFDLTMRQRKDVTCIVRDNNLRPLPGVVVKMQKTGSRYVTENLTNAVGETTFSMENNSTYTFHTKKKHYQSAPVEIMTTKANASSFKEVKLFMTKPSEMKQVVEILVASSTLRPNADYELQIHTASSSGEEDKEPEEHVVTSSQEPEG